MSKRRRRKIMTMHDRILLAFTKSPKLARISPSVAQVNNVHRRLKERHSAAELVALSDDDFVKAVEIVWVLAQYVDTEKD